MKDEDKTKKLIKKLAEMRQRIAESEVAETERKRAEEALRESEEKFKSLAEQSPNMIFINKKGGIVYANKKGEEIMGYKREEFYSPDFDFLTLIAPESIDLVKANFSRHMKGEKVPPYEFTLISKEGKRLEAILTTRLIRYGGESAILGTVTDITEHKRAGEALRKRTEQVINYQTALLELAKMDNSDLGSALKRINEVDSKTLGVERASVWFFNEDRSEIICEDLYKLSENFHEKGLRLQAKQYPRYFRALEESRTIAANDARTDPRTNEFTEGYLKPFGITSMMDVPIWLHGKVVGVVCHEHTGPKREWTLEEKDFVVSIADMVSLALEASERKRAEEQVLRQNAVLDAINKVFQEALVCESDEEVGRTCLAVAEELTGSKFGFIGEVTQAGRFDTIALSDPGWDACRMPKSDAVVMIKDMEVRGIWGRVLKDEESQIVNDPASHPDHGGTPEGHPLLTSFLGVPLKHGGRTIGMIGLANKESGYGPADQEAVESLSVAFVEALMRKRAEELLRKSEEKYRTLFEESKDVVFISTPEGKLVDINPAGVELFGYSFKEDLLEIDIAQDLYFNPQDREKYQQAIAEQGFVKDYELILKRKDGQKVIVLVTANAVRDDKGNIVAYRGIIRDVTEQRQLEQQLIQAQKMEAIGRLAGGVAHDFNNLLTSIIGYAEILEMKLPPEDPIHNHIEQILKAADHATTLIQQLLAFSRKAMIQPIVLNLNHVIENFKNMLQRMLGEDIVFEFVLSKDLGSIKADPSQIEQIVMNLAVNSREAMPKGGKLIIETNNVELDEEYVKK
ncbi:MAG: PAS domain S-box protein, partial [Candidatus Aminicenantia bacterium]